MTRLRHLLGAMASFTLLSVGATAAQAADTQAAAAGLLSSKSPYSVAVTIDRFEKLVSGKGMKIFARVDHAAGARKVNQELRPTELLIFGNPQGGTPLMQCSQSFAIDLPLKALAWEDAQGQVWLGVNDLATLAARHHADDCPAVAKVGAAVRNFVAATIKE